DKVADLEAKVKEAEAGVKAAQKPDDKQTAEQFLKSLQEQLNALKQKDKQETFIKDQQRQWEEKDAYAFDAYRLLTNYNNPCLSCHQVGNLPGKQANGPPLELTWERLRPEWTQRWIANPERMLSYSSPMPPNFAAGPTKILYPEFLG